MVMSSLDDTETNILVVDDDRKIGKLLKDYMESQGFRVEFVSTAGEFRDQVKARNFDLVLLDIGLPGTDGFSLLSELRSQSDVAIIMLTGRSDIVDRVVGIEIGADDYITKPFHLREVVARVRGVLRRTKRSRRDAEASPSRAAASDEMTFGEWKLLTEQRRLLDKHDRDVSLTGGEFDLLVALVNHAGRVLSRNQLIDLTKGPGWAVLDRTIDAQIARIRKKIESDPKRPVFIKSIRGVGYVFSEKVRAAAR